MRYSITDSEPPFFYYIHSNIHNARLHESALITTVPDPENAFYPTASDSIKHNTSVPKTYSASAMAFNITIRISSCSTHVHSSPTT